MTKLRIGAIEDDKPVRITVEFTAAVYRDLVAYGEALGRETGADAVPHRPSSSGPCSPGSWLRIGGFAGVRRAITKER